MEKERLKHKEQRDAFNIKVKDSYKELNELRKRKRKIFRDIGRIKEQKENYEAEISTLRQNGDELKKEIRGETGEAREAKEKELDANYQKIKEIIANSKSLGTKLRSYSKMIEMYDDQLDKYTETTDKIKYDADLAHGIFVSISKELRELRKLIRE